jgi:hypothetical protein
VAYRRSSPPGAREHESKFRLYQETRESAANLFDRGAHARGGWSLEFDGDLRRPDAVDDELEVAGVHGRNRGQIQI